MNILIGFEESQTVMKAFRKKGHNAYSCDLKPCSGGNPEYHLQMDIFKALILKKWDFIGIHPECTAGFIAGGTAGTVFNDCMIRIAGLFVTVLPEG